MLPSFGCPRFLVAAYVSEPLVEPRLTRTTRCQLPSWQACLENRGNIAAPKLGNGAAARCKMACHLAEKPAIKTDGEVGGMAAPKIADKSAFDAVEVGPQSPVASPSNAQRWHDRETNKPASRTPPSRNNAELDERGLSRVPTENRNHGRKARHNSDLGIKNAIRPSCIGKKNWLFIGHPEAGQRSAILYSLIVSCERRGKDPTAYLKDILTRLPRMTNQDNLGALTPENWQPAP